MLDAIPTERDGGVEDGNLDVLRCKAELGRAMESHDWLRRAWRPTFRLKRRNETRRGFE
jgi:hypothetical protein